MDDAAPPPPTVQKLSPNIGLTDAAMLEKDPFSGKSAQQYTHPLLSTLPKDFAANHQGAMEMLNALMSFVFIDSL